MRVQGISSHLLDGNRALGAYAASLSDAHQRQRANNPVLTPCTFAVGTFARDRDLNCTGTGVRNQLRPVRSACNGKT